MRDVFSWRVCGGSRIALRALGRTDGRSSRHSEILLLCGTHWTAPPVQILW